MRRAIMSQSDYMAPQAQANVVELIRDGHYLVFTNDTVLPDEGAIEELRILAYAQRKKPTLGPENAQAIETLAEAVATGVLTNVVWAGCQEAKRLVDKLPARRREPIRDAGEAERHALEAGEASQIPIALSPFPEVTVSGTG